MKKGLLIVSTLMLLVMLGVFSYPELFQESTDIAETEVLPEPISNEMAEAEEQLWTYPTIVINEVCCSNKGFAYRGQWVTSDYIELYNPSDSPVSLAGFTLTDDNENPGKYIFPDHLFVEAKSYGLVYFRIDEDSCPEKSANVPFGLSDKEIVYLGYQGVIVDAVECEEGVPGTAKARKEDGDGTFAVCWASPGETNHGHLEPIEEPVLSLESGAYEEGTLLEIASVNGAEVFYTLDGSRPTNTSLCYDGPIVLTDASAQANVWAAREDISTLYNPYDPPQEPIDKAVIIRAVSIDEEGNYSREVTGSYFVGFEEKQEYQDIPIISLVSEPEYLFGDDLGIYVYGTQYYEKLNNGTLSADSIWENVAGNTNYSARGAAWERPVHVDVLNTGDDFSGEFGLRIRGNTSRDYPQKSFTLFARDRYESGNDVLLGKLVGESTESRVALSASFDLAKTLIGDMVFDRDVSVQDHRSCQVFLNGEYWGLYDLFDLYDADYIYEKYGVPQESVLMVKETYELSEGDEQALADLKEVRNLAEKDLADPKNYEEFCRKVDMQSLIDWLCINIYIGNTDTKPFGGNVYVWKSTVIDEENPYMDGRWRWMLYDTDSAFGVGMDVSEENPAWLIDSFIEHAGFSPSSFLEDTPMKELMRNEEFRAQFKNTFKEIAQNCFSVARVNRILESLSPYFMIQKGASFARYGHTNSHGLEQVNLEMHYFMTFFERRSREIVPLMESYME